MPEPTPVREIVSPEAPAVRAYRDLEALHVRVEHIVGDLLEVVKLAGDAHRNLQEQGQAQAHLSAIPDLFQTALTAVSEADALATAANVAVFREYERQGKVNTLLRDVKRPG
jgi:hypothetical protein